jgi:hypothetical protein
MQPPQPIVNKTTNRGVIEIDLAEFFPVKGDVVNIDLKDFLFKGLIVRESDFRQQVADTDWSILKNKSVCVYCSSDAIIPMWAYMLLSVSLAPFAKDVVVATPAHAEDVFQQRAIAAIDFRKYEGLRVIVKGCGDREILPGAFALISFELAKVARSVMYGEACSSVPVFKKSID